MTYEGLSKEIESTVAWWAAQIPQKVISDKFLFHGTGPEMLEISAAEVRLFRAALEREIATSINFLPFIHDTMKWARILRSAVKTAGMDKYTGRLPFKGYVMIRPGLVTAYPSSSSDEHQIIYKEEDISGAEQSGSKDLHPEVTDDWCLAWFKENSMGDSQFEQGLVSQYQALTQTGNSPYQAWRTTVEKQPLFAHIKCS